jgi:type II secretion system protein H
MTGNEQSGFSLLEMIVALAIATLVFALVMPTDSRRRAHTELASSAREVAAALRLSRSQAITTNRSTALLVDVPAWQPDHASHDTGPGAERSGGSDPVLSRRQLYRRRSGHQPG